MNKKNESAKSENLKIEKVEEEVNFKVLKPEQIEKILKEKIAIYEAKSEAIKRRKIFVEKKEQLKGVNFKGKENDFENDDLKLILSEGYNKELFRLSNPVIIRDVIEFVINKIDSKIMELEIEISK